MITGLVKCCAGLDVHKATIVCTILQETSEGNIRKEMREYSTFQQDLQKLAQWLKEESVELAAMESTGVYWKIVYQALEDEEICAMVVNARHIKNVPGRKTDVKDSEWLAELARCGLLRASFIPPRDLRELRLITRYRCKLVGNAAAEKNRLHKILDDCGIKLGCVVKDIDGVSARRMIKALIEGQKTREEIAELAVGTLRRKKTQIIEALDVKISDRHRSLLARISKHMQWLESEIKDIDAQIVTAMEPYRPEWQLLQTIPGIDQMSAAMLLAEIGVDMSRFGRSERLCSWAGMCPGNNESARKRKNGRTRKANRQVRRLLCEVANSANKTRCQYKGFYKSLVIRRGHKRAVIAVGHKILKVIYSVLKNKKPYKDPEIDYEAVLVQRNAPRWLKALQKYNYLPTT